MKILSVKKINKKFGKKQILKDVSFDINEGEILGFIGPNGAGKTTAIKLILGLQSIDSGEVEINGYSLKKDFEKAISKVGAIVESPDLYMYLTGRDNLKMIRKLYKNISDEKFEEIIKLSGLGKRIDDKVSKYSLGMRQRLGIAASLMNNPNLLILDEPTNGLDPEGIKELRDLLKNLAKKSKIAILISSHNLSELDNFVTNVCIIQNGNIIMSGNIKDVKEYNKPHYKIELDDINKATGIISEYEKVGKNEISFIATRDEITNILKKLIKNEALIYKVEPLNMTLEEAFLNKTGGNEIV